MFKKTLLAAAALSFGGFAMTAAAGTQTTTFQVTATVINDCIISSSNIAFGNYDPTATTATTNSAGAVTAKCTKGDSVSVALGQGANSGTGSTAAVPVRQMASGTNLLPYHIYIASTGTTEWGTGTVGTNEPAAQTSTSVNTALSFPLYGSIPAGADVPAGSYTDSVVATVTY
jgi:spore coat protein U-like protein